MDTFTLQVKFRCMCFFVADDTDPGRKRMHVLMPDTTRHGHHCHGVDEHVVRLVYPTLSGGDLLGGRAHYLKMEEWALELPVGGKGADDITLPPDVVNLSDTGGPILPGTTGDTRHPNVISRVTLAAGKITHTESAAMWWWEGKPRKITQQIIWTIRDVPGKELIWRRTRLKPEGEAAAPGDVEDLPPLSPASDGIVRIEVHHVQKGDFPRPDRDRPPHLSAQHFRAFYDLFQDPPSRSQPFFLGRLETPTAVCMNGGGKKS